MIKDVSLYEAKQYKDKLEAVDGVDQILWCDSTVNIYSGEDFIRQKDIEDYYKDGCAVMDITFDQGDTAKKTSQAIDEMKAITGDKGYYVGMAVQNKSLTENVESEMNLILTVAVIMIFVHQYHRLVGTIPFSAGYGCGYFAEPGHEYFYRDSLVPHQ